MPDDRDPVELLREIRDLQKGLSKQVGEEVAKAMARPQGYGGQSFGAPTQAPSKSWCQENPELCRQMRDAEQARRAASGAAAAVASPASPIARPIAATLRDTASSAIEPKLRSSVLPSTAARVPRPLEQPYLQPVEADDTRTYQDKFNLNDPAERWKSLEEATKKFAAMNPDVPTTTYQRSSITDSKAGYGLTMKDFMSNYNEGRSDRGLPGEYMPSPPVNAANRLNRLVGDVRGKPGGGGEAAASNLGPKIDETNRKLDNLTRTIASGPRAPSSGQSSSHRSLAPIEPQVVRQEGYSQNAPALNVSNTSGLRQSQSRSGYAPKSSVQMSRFAGRQAAVKDAAAVATPVASVTPGG